MKPAARLRNSGLLVIPTTLGYDDRKVMIVWIWNYFPIAFDRTLTIPLMHRNMSIDDMAGFRIQPKFPYHSIYYFFIFKKMIIRTFCFFVSFLIRNKISFKCSHFILAK